MSTECVGVMPSLSEGLESLEDTLTESMLSPELPIGGDRGLSLTGELVFVASVPKKSLMRLERQKQILNKLLEFVFLFKYASRFKI